MEDIEAFIKEILETPANERTQIEEVVVQVYENGKSKAENFCMDTVKDKVKQPKVIAILLFSVLLIGFIARKI